MLVKKQISGPHPLVQSLGGPWKPAFYQVTLVSQGPHRGNHTHCFSRCIRYQRLESQTSMSSVSDLPTHFREAPRILEWAAISFSRGSSRPRDSTWVSCVGRQIPYRLSHQGSLSTYYGQCYWNARQSPVQSKTEEHLLSFCLPCLISPVSTFAPISLSHWFRTPPSHTIPTQSQASTATRKRNQTKCCSQPAGLK